MQSQYFHSRDKTPFIPFFKSLLNRTKQYAKIHSESAEVINVLNYLYIAIFQKFSANWSISLVSVQDYIVKLKGFKRDVFYESHRVYQNALGEKMNATKKLIKTHFTQKIENITLESENRVFRLLNELTAMQNESDEIVENVENDRAQ